VTAVHQFIPVLAPRDAVGAHTLALRDLLREQGFDSEVFTDWARPGMEGECRPYRRYRRGRGETFLLYQASIGSPVADYLLQRPEPKLAYFHNITPPHLVQAWEPEVAAAGLAGWAQLRRLAPGLLAGLAPSRYSEEALARAGVVRTGVAPLLVDLDGLEDHLDESALSRLQEDKAGADLLFVGRLSAHKAQHLLVQALWAYRRAYDPGARLHLVGGWTGQPYRDAVARHAQELGLGGAVNLAGSVTPGELAAHYRNADAFVCASRHEGFGVPLLEALHYGLPVVACQAAAVGETLGGAGVVLPGHSPLALAAAVHLVLTDSSLRTRLRAAGRERLAALALSKARADMISALRDALA
jgi:glycosyltransferase involved in cell wall biosynthesis